ncbi:MlaD family protein [Amycolatopsis suaedae]|uniref:MCE family protein n=1 Tax=Amycolatopsis suaedae TaxID=2510978 RepID=A0A4Q7JAB1_9PSEU|nr:MlaD family protein [Amycolatopsis suaedae]RZQ63852.1 MCE family protein [Amycolatopsis suaedae]
MSRALSRSVLTQLAVFLVIAVACSAYVGVRIFGDDPLGGTYRVTVHMADTGGLTPLSDVTYRGVRIGTVTGTGIRPGFGGVEIHLELRAGTRVPAATRAVVSMETPVAVTKLDLRPDTDRPPYLADGAVIHSEATSRPLPLETVLVNAMRFADSLNTEDLHKLTGELAAGLAGTTGDLTRILDASGPLMDLLRRNQPTLVSLTGNAADLLDTAGEHGRGLRETTAAMRALTGQLRGQVPAVESLLDTGPQLAQRLVPLLTGARPAVSTLMGNLVTTSQIMVTRTPALDQLLVAMPDTLHRLAGIERGGVARFYLVGAQGAACYYGTPRRPATEQGPRTPQEGWSCPGGQPGLQQRGAANAPRPAVTTYDPATGRTVAPDGSAMRIGPSGGQAGVLGPRSWYALLLQGAS